MKMLLRCLALAIFLCPPRALSSPIPVDGTAAVVNKSFITMSEVILTMQPVQRMLSSRYSGAELGRELEAAYERTLDSLIERRLILDEYESQRELVIPDRLVDMQVDEILHTRFGGNRLELMKTLEAEGLTMKEWRDEIRNRLIVSFMRGRAASINLAISPRSVREEYATSIARYEVPAQVELRMIIIHRGGTEQEVAVRRLKAEDVRRRLAAGEDFGELAVQVSEGTQAAEGGYWGWVDPASRRAELADVLKELEPGEISEVVEAGNSFYIMKVEARKHPSVIPFDEVQENIQDELASAQSQQAYEEWIEHLRQQAYIRKF